MFHITDSATNTPSVKVMFVVPKKKIKKAHDRNKLKRRMREAYRLQKGLFYEQITPSKKQINIAFLYLGSAEGTYLTIYTAIQKLLNKLTKESMASIKIK